MSHYWDIGCRTCDTVFGFSDDHNHRDAEMHDLAVKAPLLAEIAEKVKAADLNTYWRIVLKDEWDRGCDDVLGWMLDHRGHDIEAIDEYGNYFDECSKTITCSECKTRHRCRLPVKHDPPCSPEK